MTRSLLAAALALCAGLLLVTPTAAQPPGPPPPKAGPADAELVQKVKDAIDKGVRYLKKSQSRDGDWEGLVLGTIAGLKGGATSLATLALLNAGVKPDDPTVATAIEYIRKLGTPDKTYVVALQTMVFAEARQAKDKPAIERNVKWFKDHAIYKGGKLEGWSYPANAIADNSNTQYALLGLYAAKTAGVGVDDKLWQDVLDYYSRTQHADPLNGRAGYWTYHNAGDTAASFTMTVGGACGLYIAQMGLDRSEQGLDPATGVAADCGKYSENDALAKGMFWVGANFNFLEGKSYFYNYYGIERLGRLSGQRFIGKIDWYREGCERLVRMQELDGAFLARAGERKGGIDAGQPVITTSFALLFLSKGRTPVLVTKLAWGNFRKGAAGDNTVLIELDPAGAATNRPDWNRKHNDCRNVVDFAARELFDGAPLSWQVYDTRLQGLADDNARIDAEVGLLLQSPVLYLNGHGAMPFVGRGTELLTAEERVLKRYVEEGGFLFGEACCGDKDFAASFETLVGRIFPGGGLKRMPPEHSIWTMFPGVAPADFPDLMYLDRGCRTVAVFSPAPLAGYWEERRFMPDKDEARAPKNRGQKAYCLSRNVIAYATGMELPKPKLTRTILVPGVDGGIARSKFRALQLKYVSDARAQPPPAADALRNLMQYLGQQAKLDVALTSEVLGPGDAQLTRYKFMYLHGRKPVSFDADAADNVKANLQTGGLLLVDAACNDFKGWKEFDRSFREATEKMWGQKLVAIPADDPLMKIAGQAGIDLRHVRCRRENAEGTGPEKEMQTYPVHLEGIKVDGRWVVVYSKYDLGCAIEGHKSADCLGHDKESALRVAAAVVLYSLKR
jgi:hypothetical protein